MSDTKKKNYIGLACTGHDNALAIVNSSGELVFAEATERYQQNKRAINTPPDDIIRIESLINEYCEPHAELVVAKTWSPATSVAFTSEHKLAEQRKKAFFGKGAQHFIADNASIYQYVMQFVANNIQNTGDHLKFRCDTSLQRSICFKAYNHHLTHAASACFTSPFDEAVCVIVDGFGEGTSIAIYRYKDHILTPIITTPMQGNLEKSLGVFYGTLCGFCGFDLWRGEEWKVMGLAPYGKRNSELYRLLHSRLQVNGLQLECPETGNEVIEKLLSYIRRPGQSALEVADLAYTGQEVFCELMSELLNNVYNQRLSNNLVLGGGCGLNSAYNGKILQQTGFENLHVYSAPGDDGNAVGAAILAYREDHPAHTSKSYHNPYTGSAISGKILEQAIKLGRLPAETLSDTEICHRTAKLLAQGNIVGWVQGRAEFGPRALGNRSIIADPRHFDMKEKINAKVKFREEFRPFAPSILPEFGSEYFLDYQPSPYMERTLQFRPEVKEKVSAVVHADGTGRLQTINKDWNPRYYELIEAFYEITGIPLILNTSFNVMGKPIIHSVEDALAVFCSSGLDALVINNTLLLKKWL